VHVGEWCAASARAKYAPPRPRPRGAKVAQEAEIEAGGVPYTILRATQFFEFLPQIAEAGADGDLVRLPTGLMQLVAVDDVAATVAELAIGAPAGSRVELGTSARSSQAAS